MRKSPLFLLTAVLFTAFTKAKAHADQLGPPTNHNPIVAVGPYTLYYDSYDEFVLRGINAAGDTEAYSSAFRDIYVFRQGRQIAEVPGDLGGPFPFPPDNGSACSAPSSSGYVAYQSVCNGAYEVFIDHPVLSDGHQAPGSEVRTLYPGSDPLGLVVSGAQGVLGLIVSSTGDFAIVDGAYQVTYTGYLTPTPEPSTLALIGTGVLGLFGAARRKLRP